jgi:hypothetical protein
MTITEKFKGCTDFSHSYQLASADLEDDDDIALVLLRAVAVESSSSRGLREG